MLFLVIGLFLCFNVYSMEEALPSVSTSRLVLIGAGGKQAQQYFNILKDTVPFVAFVQPNAREDVRTLAQTESIPVYSDLHSVLSDNVSFDGALVVVPHYLHSKYVQELIRANKFVIKDKPLSMTAGHADEYQALYDSGSSSICTIVQRQFQPSFTQAFSDISELGRLYSFKYEYLLNLTGDTTGWRSQKSLSGGGALLDMGYHVIDMLMTFFGIPEKISAQCAYKKEKTDESTEDEIFVLLTYPNNMIGNIIISRYGSEKKEIFEIFGSEGSMHIQPQLYSLYNAKGHETVKPYYHTKQEVFKNMFLSYLSRSNDREYNTKELVRHVQTMHLIERIYQAAGVQ